MSNLDKVILYNERVRLKTALAFADGVESGMQSYDYICHKLRSQIRPLIESELQEVERKISKFEDGNT